MAAVGFASAQSTPTITVSNQGSATAPSANASGVTLGTFTLVSPQSGSAGDAQVTSIPLTLTTGSGGNASDLSACQVYGSNGSTISSSGLSSLSGTNTVTFTSPVQLYGGQSAQFTVRCNVANNISSGATYQFTAGTPTLSGSTSTPAPTGAALSLALGTTPVVRPGAQDTPMAVISLSASNSNSSIQVSALPISLSFGGGASASSVSDCRIRPLGSLGTALNNGGNVPTTVAGTNTFTLDSALSVPAGGSTSVVLTCDVSASAPSGGTVLVSVTPSSVSARVSGSSTTVTPTTATTSSGNAAPTAGSVLISASAPVTGGPTIPGVPNTGFGENTNLMVILASAIAMILGAMLLRRRMV
jgi:LPXTG-motif cell wall-anchored protein